MSELKEHSILERENQQLKDEIINLRNNTETLTYTIVEMLKIVNDVGISLNNASARLFNIAQRYNIKN